jgi:hypothetical protein
MTWILLQLQPALPEPELVAVQRMHTLVIDQAVDYMMKQRLKPQTQIVAVAAHISEDTDLDEPTSPANPIAPFPPLTHKTLSSPTKLKPATRASGGRAPEFYGFVAWLVVLLSYLLFLLWALLPDKVIHALGIHWYPARWDSRPWSVCDCSYASFVREWALLLPAWSVVVFLLAYWSYIALGIYGTPPLNDLSTITGKNSIR